MKNLKSFLLIVFFPSFCFAQQLFGVWTGVLSNDSLTERKDQSFEIALTEYKEKVYGYAYSTFIVNDTLYYILKRVKGEINGDICEVKDDEVITHNFPRKPEKGVHVIYTLRRNRLDSTWTLDGEWKTEKTKKYYALSGGVKAKEEKDLAKSRLYEHLGDLKLQHTLAFNKPKEKGKDNPVQVSNDMVSLSINPEEKTTPSIVKTETKVPDTKPATNTITDQQKPSDKKDVVSVNVKTEEKKADPPIVKTETKVPDTKPATNTITDQQKPSDKKDLASVNVKTEEKKTDPPIVKTETKVPDTKPATNTITDQQKPSDKKDVVSVNVKTEEKKADPPIVKTETKVPDTKPATNTITDQQKPSDKKDLASVNVKTEEKKADPPIVKTETKVPDTKPATNTITDQQKPSDKKDVASVNVKTEEKKTDPPIVKTETKVPDTKPATTTITDQQKPSDKKDVASVNVKAEEKKTDPVIAKTETKPPVSVKDNISGQEKENKKDIPAFEYTEIEKRQRNPRLALAKINDRESVPSETIFFQTDSLVLALYDNGEIDGDTVSVFLNNEVIIDKQVLKSVAFKKTIYFPAGDEDSVLLVLYAENLGLYPPNTGLLIIKDGDASHYVRFKADFDRNAAIMLRRKNPQ